MLPAKSPRLLKCVSIESTWLVIIPNDMFCIQSRERIERERKKSARFRRLNRRTQSECSPSKHNLPGTNTSCFSPAFDDDDDDDDKATTSSKDVSSRILCYVCGGGGVRK